MGDDFVTIREFEGLSKRIDERFRQVTDGTASLHGKLDTLLLKGSEEARVIGEISGEIRAINQRLERQEKETAELRRFQETEVANLRDEIKGVKDEQADHTKGNINWFMQLVLVVIAAMAGAYFAKHL